jgi:hypothetical protein
MKRKLFIKKVIALLSIAFTFLSTTSSAQPLIVGQINPRSLNVPCGYTGYPLVLTFQNTYAYINNFNDVNHLPSFLRTSAGLLAWYPFAYTNTSTPTSSWRIDRTGVNNQITVGASTTFLGLNASLATPSTDRFVNGIANFSGTNYNSAAAQFQIGLTNSIPSSSQYFMNSLSNANSNKGTISFWFNMSHSSLFLQNRGVFEMWDSTTSSVKLQVWNGRDTVTGNEDTLYVHHSLFGSGNSVPLVWSNIASAGNNWVHFSMTIDAPAGLAKFYLNGIFQKSFTFTPVTSTNIFGNYYQFGRVAHANGFNNIGAFSGLIDDITFYNRNLNDYENTILFKGWRVKWDNNDSTQTRLVLPPSTAVTKYTCEVYTSNSNTYYKDSITAQFIKPQPYVYPNPASVCIGSTIRLYADDSVNLNPFYWNTTNSQNQSISPSSGTGMYRKWFRWNSSNGTTDSLTTKLPNGHINFDYLDITPTLIGTDSIYIQEWNGYSCDSISRKIPLTTKALPTISSAATGTVCSGSTFAYTITSPQVGATFTWTRNANAAINGGATNSGTTATISEILTSTSSAPVVITYTVYAQFNGCTSNPFTLSVTVYPKPILSSSLTVNAQNNTAFSYTPTSSTAGTTFSWTRAVVAGISNIAGSGTGAINETLVNTTANPINVTYVYTLTANGCPNTQNVVVTVRPLPVLSSASTSNACTGTAFTYTATSATIGTTFSWTRAVVAGISNAAGSGSSATINETLINTTSSPILVTYTYTLLANTLSNTQTVSVTVNPSVTASASLTTMYQGSTSTLSSSLTGTGFTYQWYNNGTLITGATASTYAATASGSYTVIVNTGNCSITSSSVTITVNTIPTPTISAGGPTTFCAGANVVLSTTVMAGMTYQWYNNGTAIAGATSSTYTATASASYTVKYINGASSSSISTATTVTVNTLPSATITPSGATTLTQGSSVTLNAVTGANLSYQWNLNGTAIAGATSSSYVVTSTVVATLNYTVTVTNTLTNCVSTTGSPTVVTFGTIGTPSISNGAAPTTFCQGGSVTLTATSIVAGYTYQWYNNGTAISGATSATYSATVSGAFTFTQTNGGVTSSMSNAINVTVNMPATATATAGGPTTFLQGSNVTLTSNTGTGFTYQWYNSTTLITGATSASFTATTSGSYNVRITDANGCISNASNTIFVNVTPINTPTITANGPTTFCPGGNVILSSNVVVGVNYQWNLNGVAIAGATAATYQAVSAGNYTVTQSNGTYTTTSVSTSVVISMVNATITAGGPTTFFAGSNVSLTANTGTGFTYQWYNNGTIISGATNSSFSASMSGSYTVTITNALLCTFTSSATVVTVNPIPTPNISAGGPTTFCAGANVTLSAVAQTGMTYQWYMNSVIIAGATSATYSATASGAYTFTQTNGSVTSTVSNSISVTANPLPSAVITAGGPTTFVNGGSVTLSATLVTGMTYQWYNGASPISGANSNTYTATLSGNYTLQITSASNCTSTSNAIIVSVGAIPTPTISAGGPTTFCNGDSVTLTATVVTGMTYQWYLNGTVISGATNTTIKVFNSGSYTFVQTNGAASSSPSSPISVTVNALPTATITAGGPTTFYNGSNVVLSSNTGAGFSYQWYNGTTLITGATSSTYTAIVSGNYKIKITNSFGCFTYSTPIAVTVNAVPTPVIVAGGPTTFCAGANVVLSITAYAGFTYQWYSNGIAISGAIGTSYTATTSSNYTVIQTNGTVSSSVSVATTVTVNTLPSATATPGGPITFYQGSSVSLSANIGTGLSYQWYQNATTLISGATSATYVASTTASYTVVVTNANGCSQTSNAITVTANTIPTPVITANGPTTFCQGGTVMFTATVVAGMSYQWYNNGVAIVGATTATFTASASGNYTFTQRNGTVTSAVSNTQICTVHPLPIASISAGGSTTFYQGSNVILTALTGTGYLYQWYANGLPISGATSNIYIATTTASYYVVVTSSITNCVSTNSNTINVNVIGLPTPVLTANGSTTICSGDSVVLSTNTVPNLPNVQYAWKWNGNIISTNFNSFYIATQPGVYTVEYVNGLVYSNTSNAISIIVNPLPILPTITSNAPLCVGGNLNLGNNVPLGVTYSWTGPNGFTSTLSSPSIISTTIADSGRYYLTITNTTTGCKNTNNANIIVSAYPNANILNTTLSYCEGSSLVLNANTGSNLSYQWYNGTNSIFNAINANYTVTQPGTYAVIVKNQYNCSTTSSPKTVVQIPLPVAVITAVNTNTICEGDTAFMSTPSGVGYTYEWYKSNVFMPGFNTSLAYATTAAFYQVKVTANGCSRTSVLYGVVVHSLTKPVIVQNGNVLSTQAYATYQWRLNGVPIPGANGQSIMINQIGNYTVKVSSFGCFDSSNVYAFTTGVNTIQQNAIYAAPNPTTGKFMVYGLSAANIEVYNMFGALVKTVENSNEIDLSAFAQGIYTIRLFDDKHQLRYTDKIMKQD